MKKLLTFACIAALALTVLCLAPVSALADEVTGACGENVNYVYDTVTKVLTVSGTGATADYTSSGNTRSPFYTNTTIRNNCTSIVVEEGVTEIGSWLFYYMQQVTSVSLPSTLTSIHTSGFNNLVKLTECELPQGLETIGEQAFNNCKLMPSLTIPSSVTFIGKKAFYGWNALTEVTIPGSVKTIDQFAFQNCRALTSLTLEEGIETIGQEAFNGCGVTEDTIPASVTTMGFSPWKGCNNLAAYNVAEGSQSYAAYDGVLYTYGYETLLHAPMAKQGSVTVMDGCKTIGENAFENCFGVTAITLPEGLETISGGAMQGTGITSIEIPASVTSIGSMVFNYCEQLQTAVVNTTAVPGDNFFYGCSSLTSVTLAEGTPAYGMGEFAYCSSLASVPVIEGITEIPDSLFVNCSSLESFDIPDTVTRIGQNAFSGCTALTEIAIPAGVTSIDMYAFQYCTGVTAIELPEGLTNLGTGAFADSGLTGKVTVPASVTDIQGQVFTRCQNLTEVDLLGDIVYVRSNAFANCSKLVKVTFHCAPLSTQNANAYAFNGTNKDFEIHYPSTYPAWDTERPFDQYGKTYVYVMDTVAPIVEAVRAELRARPTEDNKRDLRFIAKLIPSVGVEVTARRAVLTLPNGSTHTLDCPKDFEVNDDGTVTFTAVIKSVPERYFDFEFSCTFSVDYTGELEGAVSAEPIVISVNQLEEQD